MVWQICCSAVGMVKLAHLAAAIDTANMLQSSEIGALVERSRKLGRKAVVHLAVNGTLMRGLELNGNMQKVGAEFVREAQTEPAYRLWSIGDRHPAMQRVATGGVAIPLEVWAVPPDGISTLLQLEPPGLCIGKVRLSDGEEVLGVLGEAILCEGQLEITQFGGWRAYINQEINQEKTA